MNHRMLNVVGVMIVLMLSCFLLFWGMYYLKDEGVQKQQLSFDVLFRDVGTLTKGDPVKANGVKIGRVSDIRFDPAQSKVRVSVEVDGDFPLPHNSEIRLQNIGLLGERQIGITLGNSKDQWIHAGETLPGIYDYGIAETMATAGEVFDSARVLLSTVQGVVDSTIATPKFKQDFNQILDQTLLLQRKADSLVRRVDPSLRRSLSNLQTASVRVNQLLEDNRAPLKQTVDNTHKLSVESRALVAKADSLTQRLNRITAKLESSDNTAGALMQNRELYEDLRSTLKSTDSLMLIIINRGLDVNIGLF